MTHAILHTLERLVDLLASPLVGLLVSLWLACLGGG